MNAFLYSLLLQCKLDIRSKSLLITCYIVPLLFFLVMGGIFTSLMPDISETLIGSMTIMGVSMGALIGVPPSLAEVYGSDISNMYKANGIPLYFGLCSILISAFLHLMVMSMIITILGPLLFQASLPADFLVYLLKLAFFIIVDLSIAAVLGVAIKNQAKLTMYAQLIFLPSIMLSGIMFSADLLPDVLAYLGKLFPAAWAYILFNETFDIMYLVPLFLMLIIASASTLYLLANRKKC